jgi:hypothetical protein
VADELGVAVVYDAAPLEVAEARAALTEMLGEEVGQPALVGYAGPNETMQLLFNGDQWLKILAVLGSVFGTGFVAGLGKNAADEVWKRKTELLQALKSAVAAPFRRLIMAIVAARSRGQTVTLAVPYPYRGRNAGLVIPTSDPVEVLRYLSLFARSASEIHAFLQANFIDPTGKPLAQFGQNEDLSVKIEIGADDKLILRWYVRSGQPGGQIEARSREFS